MADAGNLIRARCVAHPQREAAARCPECRRPFCRECVVEHGRRMICAACLARQDPRRADRRRTILRSAGGVAAVLAGFFGAWLFFYLMGDLLSSLPDRFDTVTASDEGAPGAAP